MQQKVKQKIILCIFLKIWSFYPKVRNFSCFDILESIISFKVINILKNTLNMQDIRNSQVSTYLNWIQISQCKIIKKSSRSIENLEGLKGWVTLETANGKAETNGWVVYIIYIYIYIYNIYIMWLTISTCYGSIPLALGLIGRDGGLSTLVA